MRVLVCGSRTYRDDHNVLLSILDGIYGITDSPLTVIHGHARGADTLAHEYGNQPILAEHNLLHVEPYPADWDKHGKRAGYIRNRQMLEEGKPDLVLAFVDKPLAESKGTAMMVALAKKAGVPTYVIQRA